MQQRITFVHKPGDAIDPKSIVVSTGSIAFTNLKAIREDRITFNLDEIPRDIRQVLEESHELHIRYSKDAYEPAFVPFLAKASPGFHVFYTPRAGSVTDDPRAPSSTNGLLCPLLRDVLGMVDDNLCLDVEKSFTRLPSHRFMHTTALSYYVSGNQFHSSSITQYLFSKCSPNSRLCREQLYLLSRATSLDVSYDAMSNTLLATIISPAQTWDVNLNALSDRLEVGILSAEPAFEPEHLSMGGFLAVVGEDKKFSPVQFTFPSRHHPHSSTYSTKFHAHSGLHPTLEITIPNLIAPQDREHCALHSYLTLPKHVFVDKYQFNDPLALASKNLTAIHYLSQDVDLEAPAYAVDTWGASMLVELATPFIEDIRTAHPYTAEIPLHVRYMPLSQNSSYREISIPEPLVFWACRGVEGSKYVVNPFDRVHLGYDGLFGARTLFHHLSAENVMGDDRASGYMNIRVPVLNRAWASTVEIGTLLVVLLGFLWIMFKLGLVVRKIGVGEQSISQDAAIRKNIGGKTVDKAALL